MTGMSGRGGAASGRVGDTPKPNDPTCADSGAQVLPPARATVPPSLRESSSRVSSLLACSALGPPASAAQYSCRREPCTGRSAWLPLGRACLSALTLGGLSAFLSPLPLLARSGCLLWSLATR
jgi:hypothetical protein